MTPADFITAARNHTIAPQSFGMWEILRQDLNGWDRFKAGNIATMTVLCRHSIASLHQIHGEVVMEDSVRELRKHLGIWMTATGRVLKTGLGLGCVVRGLLIKPEVTHIDVIEIDADIIRIIGAEFVGNPHVTIHHADALTFDIAGRTWDYIWHDIWCPGNDGLQVLHAQMIARYLPACRRQGAWDFPRDIARRLPIQLLGAPRITASRARNRSISARIAALNSARNTGSFGS